MPIPKPDTTYYSNSGTGSVICRELISQLFHSFSCNFRNTETIKFIEQTRIPNERELYGLFLRSLLNNDLKCDLGHIATELQVSRGNDAKGRVDIYFEYRNISFIVELKVARIGIKGGVGNADKDPDDDENPLVRIVKPWKLENCGAVSQLREIQTDNLYFPNKRIVKMPVVLYLHVDWRDDKPYNNWKDLSSKTHSRIRDALQNDELPKFHYYSLLKDPIRTHRRTSVGNMTLYSFSLFASDLE
jgi:hypothetical protein